jgi:hypothetical protein
MLLTNSNGEYGDGSSNKTPHIVGDIHTPPLVAHRLQLYEQISGEESEAGDRESIDTVPPDGGRFKGR